MQAINRVNRRGRVKKLQIGHKAKENRQKETSPSRVRNGKADGLDNSHFSQNFLTPDANILV